MYNWLKKHGNRILQVLLFAVFPVICAFIYGLRFGHPFRDLYLPGSYWNDELFYFKQVEAVVDYGLPQGWFGFEEMHGSVYPFAAWNPAVLLPYIGWGILFGWNLMSPVYANLFYNAAALAGFALLVKPDKKQSIFVLLLLWLFGPYSRYFLSSMPETVYMSMGIWMAALCISYNRKPANLKIALMFVISALITLGRPYLILFMVFPAYFLWKKNRWKGLLLSGLIGGATAVLYFVISDLCCSPYFIPLIETDWLISMKEEGFGAGIVTMLKIVREKLQLLFTHHFPRAFQYGLLSGSLHTMAAFTSFALGIRFLWLRVRKKKDENSAFWVLQFLITAGMLAAILLFYPIADGAKHWMIFIVMGLLWIAMTEEKFLCGKIIAAGLCAFLFLARAWAPFDWEPCFDADGAVRAEAEDFGAQLDSTMELKDTENRFDNTVIWLASDVVDGQHQSAAWGYLYMVPEGFGINFCFQETVMKRLDSLQSAYIAVIPGGEVDQALSQKGMTVLGETQHVKMYALR